MSKPEDKIKEGLNSSLLIDEEIDDNQIKIGDVNNIFNFNDDESEIEGENNIINNDENNIVNNDGNAWVNPEYLKDIENDKKAEKAPKRSSNYTLATKPTIATEKNYQKYILDSKYGEYTMPFYVTNVLLYAEDFEFLLPGAQRFHLDVNNPVYEAPAEGEPEVEVAPVLTSTYERHGNLPVASAGLPGATTLDKSGGDIERNRKEFGLIQTLNSNRKKIFNDQKKLDEFGEMLPFLQASTACLDYESGDFVAAVNDDPILAYYDANVKSTSVKKRIEAGKTNPYTGEKVDKDTDVPYSKIVEKLKNETVDEEGNVVEQGPFTLLAEYNKDYLKMLELQYEKQRHEKVNDWNDENKAEYNAKLKKVYEDAIDHYEKLAEFSKEHEKEYNKFFSNTMGSVFDTDIDFQRGISKCIHLMKGRIQAIDMGWDPDELDVLGYVGKLENAIDHELALQDEYNQNNPDKVEEARKNYNEKKSILDPLKQQEAEYERQIAELEKQIKNQEKNAQPVQPVNGEAAPKSLEEQLAELKKQAEEHKKLVDAAQKEFDDVLGPYNKMIGKFEKAEKIKEKLSDLKDEVWTTNVKSPKDKWEVIHKISDFAHDMNVEALGEGSKMITHFNMIATDFNKVKDKYDKIYGIGNDLHEGQYRWDFCKTFFSPQAEFNDVITPQKYKKEQYEQDISSTNYDPKELGIPFSEDEITALGMAASFEYGDDYYKARNTENFYDDSRIGIIDNYTMWTLDLAGEGKKGPRDGVNTYAPLMIKGRSSAKQALEKYAKGDKEDLAKIIQMGLATLSQGFSTTVEIGRGTAYNGLMFATSLLSVMESDPELKKKVIELNAAQEKEYNKYDPDIIETYVNLHKTQVESLNIDEQAEKPGVSKSVKDDLYLKAGLSEVVNDVMKAAHSANKWGTKLKTVIDENEQKYNSLFSVSQQFIQRFNAAKQPILNRYTNDHPGFNSNGKGVDPKVYEAYKNEIETAKQTLINEYGYDPQKRFNDYTSPRYQAEEKAVGENHAKLYLATPEGKAEAQHLWTSYVKQAKNLIGLSRSEIIDKRKSNADLDNQYKKAIQIFTMRADNKGVEIELNKDNLTPERKAFLAAKYLKNAAAHTLLEEGNLTHPLTKFGPNGNYNNNIMLEYEKDLKNYIKSMGIAELSGPEMAKKLSELAKTDVPQKIYGLTESRKLLDDKRRTNESLVDIQTAENVLENQSLRRKWTGLYKDVLTEIKKLNKDTKEIDADAIATGKHTRYQELVSREKATIAKIDQYMASKEGSIQHDAEGNLITDTAGRRYYAMYLAKQKLLERLEQDKKFARDEEFLENMAAQKELVDADRKVREREEKIANRKAERILDDKARRDAERIAKEMDEQEIQPLEEEYEKLRKQDDEIKQLLSETKGRLQEKGFEMINGKLVNKAKISGREFLEAAMKNEETERENRLKEYQSVSKEMSDKNIDPKSQNPQDKDIIARKKAAFSKLNTSCLRSMYLEILKNHYGAKPNEPKDVAKKNEASLKSHIQKGFKANIDEFKKIHNSDFGNSFKKVLNNKIQNGQADLSHDAIIEMRDQAIRDTGLKLQNDFKKAKAENNVQLQDNLCVKRDSLINLSNALGSNVLAGRKKVAKLEDQNKVENYNIKTEGEIKKPQNQSRRSSISSIASF